MPRLTVRPVITLEAYKRLVISAIRNRRSLESHLGVLLETLDLPEVPEDDIDCPVVVCDTSDPLVAA